MIRRPYSSALKSWSVVSSCHVLSPCAEAPFGVWALAAASVVRTWSRPML